MKLMTAFAFITLTLLTVGQTDGAAITGLFATGVDSAGSILGDNADDPHYTLLPSGGAAKTIFSSSIPGSWVANDPASRWVWETASGTPTDVTRTFRITFDLTGLLPTTAQISGTWSTDNSGLDILINGNSTANTSGGFSAFTNFTIDSGFVPGTNNLDFVVQDLGSISGFRVGSISGTAAVVPEPSASTVGLLLALCTISFTTRTHHAQCRTTS